MSNSIGGRIREDGFYGDRLAPCRLPGACGGLRYSVHDDFAQSGSVDQFAVASQRALTGNASAAALPQRAEPLAQFTFGQGFSQAPAAFSGDSAQDGASSGDGSILLEQNLVAGANDAAFAGWFCFGLPLGKFLSEGGFDEKPFNAEIGAGGRRVAFRLGRGGEKGLEGGGQRQAHVITVFLITLRPFCLLPGSCTRRPPAGLSRRRVLAGPLPADPRILGYSGVRAYRRCRSAASQGATHLVKAEQEPTSANGLAGNNRRGPINSAPRQSMV